MLQVAIYGKGGIGKSTITANLSAALALRGNRVLQVGCDPKHDSTRLLLGGRKIRTVLDYLRETPPPDRRLEDVVHKGYGDVCCVEAGGPEPGVGCAGRGILSTFELLEELGIRHIPFDVALYDVLGDVVCGGFAVPLRREYADVIYVVSSGEFFPIYAANNILRGVGNYDSDAPRLGGLLFNNRGRDVGKDRMDRFAEAVGLPVIATFPASDLFARAERLGNTVIEAFGDSEIAAEFIRLAESITPGGPAYPARPLEDEDLERLVLGDNAPLSFEQAFQRAQPASANPARIPPAELNVPPEPGRFLSKSVRNREPLHGCAFVGALNTTVQIRDAMTVSHGPRSCSHIACQTLAGAARRTLAVHGMPLGEMLSPAVMDTNLSEERMIFGGAEALESTLAQAALRNPKAIFVLTSCAAGIIGDDVPSAIKKTEAIRTGLTNRILPISTDGNIAGDYLQGVINACLEGAAALIDRNVSCREDAVNIVAERNIATNAEANFRTVSNLLAGTGLRVHCRFVRRTTVDRIREFRQAGLNLLAYEDTYGRSLRDYLTGHFGAQFAPHPFPAGFSEAVRWLRSVAEPFGRREQADRVIEQQRQLYEAQVARLRPCLEGRRLLIITYNHDIDWLLETAFDLGMEVLKVGLLDYSQDDLFRSRYRAELRVETGYPPEKRGEDIIELKPDIVLTNYMPVGLPAVAHYASIPLCPDVGFLSGLQLAQRWQNLVKLPPVEGWKRDEHLARSS